ncbi:unnamed protein product [Calicophoron daubneyi]|uniref:Programmed cell death protein 10 dimerisation domain-containing protein n=1 Tax=Calicophoron daubneyi TaxID=300641 RepID=A0AAV2T1G4_CALDB
MCTAAAPLLFDTLSTLDHKDHVSTDCLRSAFERVEAKLPGFSERFLIGLLHHFGQVTDVSAAELSLWLATLEEAPIAEHYCDRRLFEFACSGYLMKRALACIPKQIEERQNFIEAIREVAISLRRFLDSSVAVESAVSPEEKQILRNETREMVHLCKEFSGTLKSYFGMSDKNPVFESAARLIHCINTLLGAVNQNR